MTHTVYVTIKLVIDSDLPMDDMMDEIASECSYDFPSTDNAKVTHSEWLDTSTLPPIHF
jgi:hypothetical protein